MTPWLIISVVVVGASLGAAVLIWACLVVAKRADDGLSRE